MKYQYVTLPDTVTLGTIVTPTIIGDFRSKFSTTGLSGSVRSTRISLNMDDRLIILIIQ